VFNNSAGNKLVNTPDDSQLPAVTGRYAIFGVFAKTVGEVTEAITRCRSLAKRSWRQQLSEGAEETDTPID